MLSCSPFCPNLFLRSPENFGSGPPLRLVRSRHWLWLLMALWVLVSERACVCVSWRRCLCGGVSSSSGVSSLDDNSTVTLQCEESKSNCKFTARHQNLKHSDRSGICFFWHLQFTCVFYIQLEIPQKRSQEKLFIIPFFSRCQLPEPTTTLLQTHMDVVQTF